MYCTCCTSQTSLYILQWTYSTEHMCITRNSHRMLYLSCAILHTILCVWDYTYFMMQTTRYLLRYTLPYHVVLHCAAHNLYWLLHFACYTVHTIVHNLFFTHELFYCTYFTLHGVFYVLHSAIHTITYHTYCTRHVVHIVQNTHITRANHTVVHSYCTKCTRGTSYTSYCT